jgi:hypothetical protein
VKNDNDHHTMKRRTSVLGSRAAVVCPGGACLAAARRATPRLLGWHSRGGLECLRASRSFSSRPRRARAVLLRCCILACVRIVYVVHN